MNIFCGGGGLSLAWRSTDCTLPKLSTVQNSRFFSVLHCCIKHFYNQSYENDFAYNNLAYFKQHHERTASKRVLLYMHFGNNAWCINVHYTVSAIGHTILEKRWPKFLLSGLGSFVFLLLARGVVMA